MSPSHKQRRSQRVVLDVSLLVTGETEDKQPFEEEVLTLIVNAHGTLVMLEAKVSLGQAVILTNIRSGEKRKGTVAFVGSRNVGLAQVGIQFSTPAPEFWLLSSPPPDWNAT